MCGGKDKEVPPTYLRIDGRADVELVHAVGGERHLSKHLPLLQLRHGVVEQEHLQPAVLDEVEVVPFLARLEDVLSGHVHGGGERLHEPHNCVELQLLH